MDELDKFGGGGGELTWGIYFLNVLAKRERSEEEDSQRSGLTK